MRLFLALSIFLALCPLACRAEPCDNGVRLDGEFIELSGVLHRQVLWGPPNFGEHPQTDSTFTAWIISLNKPLVIQGGAQIGDQSLPSVTEIKLSSYGYTAVDDTEHLEPLDGKLVVVTGKLWQGIARGDVTPVTLAAKTIEPTDQDICRVTPRN